MLIKRLFIFFEPVFIRPAVSMFSPMQGQRFPVKQIYALKILLQIFFNIFFSPIGLVLNLFKVVILPINISQIGNVIWLDCFLREVRKDDKKYNLIIVPSSDLLAANPYLLSLYSDKVYLAKNLIEYILLFPFFLNPLCTDFLERFDANSNNLNIHKSLGDQDKKNTPIIEIPHKDKIKALVDLDTVGLKEGEKFVTIHVRDSGYYNNPGQNTRNGTFENYIEGIKYLSSRGYKIIRLGNSNSKNIKHLYNLLDKNFIDYAYSNINSDLIDIYLMSECEFLLGTDSGPAFVVPLFKKNTLMTNAMPPSRSLWFNKDDLTIFKKIKYKDNKIEKLSVILSPKLYNMHNIHSFNKLGYEVIENSSFEILDLIKDYFNKNDYLKISNQIKKGIEPGCRNYMANGNFSYSFILNNFKEEVCNDEKKQ